MSQREDVDLRSRIAMAIARYDWNNGLSANGAPGVHTMGETDAVLDVVLPLLESVEASRRDWAAEAMAMDAIAERVLTFHGQNEERLSFIARRYLGPARHRDRFTGISSDALAWFAIGRRDEPKPGEYPADERDLAACERTYEMAPEFLKGRMLPVLERYRKHVAAQCAVHPEADR